MPKVQASSDVSPGRGRGRRVSSSLAEINVVPLVDVMLVLLIIFMVATPMMQRGVDVKLPVATRTQEIQGERLFVTIPADYRQRHTVYLGDDQVRLEILQERVRQKVESRTDKQVYLRGDGSVSYSDLMEVFDRLKGAGVLNIGLINRLPGER